MKKVLFLMLVLPLMLLSQSASELSGRSQAIFDLSCQNKAIAKILEAGEISGVKQTDSQMAEYRTAFYDNEQAILDLLLDDVRERDTFIVDSNVFESLNELIALKAKFYAKNREETAAYLESIKTKLSGEFEVLDPDVLGTLDLLIAEADSRFYVAVRTSVVQKLSFIKELLK